MCMRFGLCCACANAFCACVRACACVCACVWLPQSTAAGNGPRIYNNTRRHAHHTHEIVTLVVVVVDVSPVGCDDGVFAVAVDRATAVFHQKCGISVAVHRRRKHHNKSAMCVCVERTLTHSLLELNTSNRCAQIWRIERRVQVVGLLLVFFLLLLQNAHRDKRTAPRDASAVASRQRKTDISFLQNGSAISAKVRSCGPFSISEWSTRVGSISACVFV